MPCAKVIELIGCSDKSFDDAIKEALTRANKTLRNISGMQIVSQTVKVKEGKITEYRVTVKISFGVE